MPLNKPNNTKKKKMDLLVFSFFFHLLLLLLLVQWPNVNYILPNTDQFFVHTTILQPSSFSDFYKYHSSHHHQQHYHQAISIDINMISRKQIWPSIKLWFSIRNISLYSNRYSTLLTVPMHKKLQFLYSSQIICFLSLSLVFLSSSFSSHM